MTALAPDGSEDAAALGARADAPASVLRSLIASDADGAADVIGALAGQGLNPTGAMAVRLFGEWSPPGSSQTFVAERPVVVVVAAPEGASVLEGGVPASDLDVEVRRTRPRTHDELELPPPLAEPRLDFRVDRATALSYEVKAGEYIQIIDVEGKQCSDFLAFHRRKLEDGVERGFDPTITRTLMGNAFPQPGLYSKFFDLDMDVAGRGDPRHRRAPRLVPARVHVPLLREPRVLRAHELHRQLQPAARDLRDRAAEGLAGAELLLQHDVRDGQPARLRRAVVPPRRLRAPSGGDRSRLRLQRLPGRRRPRERLGSDRGARPRLLPRAHVLGGDRASRDPRRRADAHDGDGIPSADLRSSTSRTTEYNGYWLPTSFDNHGATDEYWACRERAAIMDLSPLRKFEVLGPDAEALMQATVTRDVRRLADGHVVYTAMCNEAGGMIDDATIFRIADTNFRFVGGSEYDGVWLREQAARLGLNAFVKESTDHLHNVAVQGPASRDLLKPVVWVPPSQTPFEALGWFRFSVGRIGGPKGVPAVISRTGYTGELGYEIFCHPKDAPAVWDTVWEAGEAHGLAPLGLDALDILRIEAGLIFAGYEFDDQIDPFEAGIGFTVTKDKDEDFVGREALRGAPRASAASPGRPGARGERDGRPWRRRLRRPPAGGVVTSGTRSPILKKNIALARVAVQHRDPGTALEVGKLDGQQKRIGAQVVRFPFYDPDKTRPRS